MSSPQQPDFKGKESKHGEFKEQDRNSLSTKAEQAIGLLVKGKEESEQKKNDTSLPTKDLKGIEMPVVKQGSFKEGSRKDWIAIAQKKEQLKFDMKMIRSEIRNIKKAINAQEHEVERLEDVKAWKDLCLEDLLKFVEKQIEDAQSLFENASNAKQEMNDKIAKLTDEAGVLKSEIVKIEEVLNKYKRYRSILFTLSPPEWQEVQQAETLRTKVLPKSAEGLESYVDSSPDTVLPPTSESTLSSDHSDTPVRNPKLDGDSTVYEDELQLYFSDPQEVVALLSKLTDQNLSLIQNITRVDKTMEQTIEITTKKIKEDEEKLIKQVEDMENRVNSERKRVATLKKNVQLHDSLKTEDQDSMLHSLAVKVTEVYSSCVDERPTQLGTLEKLSSIEYHLSLLQQQIDSIPEEMLNTLRHIKKIERRNRQREERLKLEMEKHRERMEKYSQRSLGEAKKIHGRKLMPRCFPVKQKMKVVDEDAAIEDHLFSEDSDKNNYKHLTNHETKEEDPGLLGSWNPLSDENGAKLLPQNSSPQFPDMYWLSLKEEGMLHRGACCWFGKEREACENYQLVSRTDSKTV